MSSTMLRVWNLATRTGSSGILHRLACRASAFERRNTLKTITTTTASRLQPGCFGGRLSTPTASRTTSNFGTALSGSNTRCFSQALETSPEAGNQRQTSDEFVNPQLLDRELQRLDANVRRSGRITSREINSILSQAARISELTSNHALLLIRTTGGFLRDEKPEVRTSITERAWKMFDQNLLDVSHYNALLQVHLENSKSFDPLEFLQEMKSVDIVPNRVTYQRLIQRYCDMGDIEGASRILEFMKNEQMAVSAKVFNSLIRGHLKTKDVDSARNIFELMKSSQVEPTSESYLVLACGLAENGAPLEDVLGAVAGKALSDEQVLRIFFALSTAGKTSADELRSVLETLPKGMGYTQDLINSCLDLITADRREAAHIVFDALPMGNGSEFSGPRSYGSFYIQQLVKCGAPIEEVDTFCAELMARAVNDHPYRKAAEAALSVMDVSTQVALEYLELLRTKGGMAMRPQFFYPLLAGAKSDSEIYDLLRLMQEHKAHANYDAMTDFVFPRLSIDDPDAVVSRMSAAGYTVRHSLGCLLHHMLNSSSGADVEQTLDKVIELLGKYPVQVDGNRMVPALINIASRNTAQCKKVVEILSRTVRPDGRDGQNSMQNDLVGRFLNGVLPSAFDACVAAVREQGLSVGRERFNQLQGKNLNVAPLEMNVVDYREELSDSFSQHQSEMSLEELESHLIELESKNMNTRGVVRKLLMQYCRNRDVEKAEEMQKKLADNNEPLSMVMNAQLSELYTSIGQLDKALEYYKVILNSDNFQADDHKVINLATLLTQNKRFDEGMRLLSDHHQRFADKRRNTDTLQRNVARLIQATVANVSIEKAREVFEKLVVEQAYVPVSSWVVSPLIRHYLSGETKNINAALDIFEEMGNTHRVTPCKSDICTSLIMAGDTANLQRVIDISNLVHGEGNTQIDLAICYLFCGDAHKDQVISCFRGISRFPRLGSRLETVMDSMVDRDQVKELAALLEISRVIPEIRTDSIYYHLIRAYARKDDIDGALDVWTGAQEDNTVLSYRTLHFLENILKHAGRPVPFKVSSVRGPLEEHTTEDGPRGNETSSIRSLLHMGDMNSALTLRAQQIAEGVPISHRDESALVSALFNNGDLDTAFKITREMLGRPAGAASHPSPRLLRSLLTKIASRAGSNDQSVGQISELRSLMSSDLILTSSIDFTLCLAHVYAGRAEEYLGLLEKSDPGSFIPVKPLVDNCPELADRVYELAAHCAEKGGNLTPLNVIWQRHFSAGEYAKADAIMEKYPSIMERLNIKDARRTAIETQDEKMSSRLHELLWRHERPKVNAIGVSTHVEVLLLNKKLEEAIDIIRKAKNKGLDLSLLSMGAVRQLRKEAALSEKTIDIDLPETTADH